MWYEISRVAHAVTLEAIVLWLRLDVLYTSIPCDEVANHDLVAQLANSRMANIAPNSAIPAWPLLLP